MRKRSFYLNDHWDITLDGSGNLQTTTGRYCDAQNVANAIRLFTEDAYLAQNQGVPHFTLDLAVKPSLSEVRAIYRDAAIAVENIVEADVEIYGIDTDTRVMTGLITSTNEMGETFTVEI